MAFYFNPSRQHPLVPPEAGPQLDAARNTAALSARRDESLASVLSARSESPSLDTEWVVFSPQLSSRESVHQDEATTPGDDADIDDAASSDISVMDDAGGATGGTATPLAFPSHGGDGSFLLRSDLSDRINQWRLDQSQLVFSELQRLERRLFSRSPSVGAGLDDHGAFVPDLAESPGTSAANANEDRKESVWDRVTRKVVREWIGLSDEVLEIVSGERFVDGPPRGSHKHLDNLPPGWEAAVVARVFRELGISRVNVALVRAIGERLMALNPHSRAKRFVYDDRPFAAPPFARHYWEDSILSPNYWEQASSVSTPVW